VLLEAGEFVNTPLLYWAHRMANTRQLEGQPRKRGYGFVEFFWHVDPPCRPLITVFIRGPSECTLTDGLLLHSYALQVNSEAVLPYSAWMGYSSA
jgi:hypothetical protein